MVNQAMCDDYDYGGEPDCEPVDPMFDNDLAFPELVDEENWRDAQEADVERRYAEAEREARKSKKQGRK